MIGNGKYEKLDGTNRFSSVGHAVMDGCCSIWKKITGKLGPHRVNPAPEQNRSQKLFDSYYPTEPLWQEKTPILTKVPYATVGAEVYPASPRST